MVEGVTRRNALGVHRGYAGYPTAVPAKNRITCDITFEATTAASLALQVAAAGDPDDGRTETLDLVSNGSQAGATVVPALAGGREHVVTVLRGPLTVRYEATLAEPATRTPKGVSDRARNDALRPSRYCPSDRLEGFARSHFGGITTNLDRVRAICDYVHTHIVYMPGTSGPVTDAVDTLLAGAGVCRDFAHLAAALCRAVQVPARVAAVYAPGLSPMDFHVVVETEIDGSWWVWDPTRLAPRQSLVRVANSREGVNIAFSTVLSGHVELLDMTVSAVAAGELPTDDHAHLTSLV
jgi:transglutaminase-like putative cysteine protease